MNRHWLWCSICSLLLVSIYACSDDQPAAPTAQVRFIHSIEDLGTLEVFLETDRLVTLKAGEISESKEIAPGLRRIALRNSGASSNLLEDRIEFLDQGYLIAFVGKVSDSSLGILSVDTPAPTVESGSAAAEVVHLLDGAFVFDVYVGTTLVASSLSYSSVSDFATFPSGTSLIKRFNAGDNPASSFPIQQLEHHFESGRAEMILLRGTGTAVTIDLVTVK